MSETLSTFLDEQSVFEPNASFAQNANITDLDIYDKADSDFEGFWEDWAKKLHWFEPWTKVLDWKLPYAQWFLGGKINAAYNSLDRHADGPLANKTAILFEGEPGDVKKYTFRELRDEVAKVANALKELGVHKGDRVCVYMPMIPELAISMLACARIGAVHSVVFGGFSSESLFDRINDAKAKVIMTADGGWRRGGVVQLKKMVDEALASGCPSIEKVLVYSRTGVPGTLTNGVPTPDYDRGGWVEGRDFWWHDVVNRQSADCPCEPMDAQDPLFILYTSGSTGKPKGIVHAIGGYLVGTYATGNWVFDWKDSDVWWCTADCGWVTGHTYIVYGPLMSGVTSVMYEGSPDTPDKARFWRIIEKHKITILYTAPTAIRAFMKWGNEFPEKCDLSSLRLLGSVGEPINPEAWLWYHEHIGKGNCPVVDTWWQTETGHILIAPLPGITKCKPGSATRTFPGISAAIYSEDGHNISDEHVAKIKAGNASGSVQGFLVLTRPWPGMTRGIYGDPQRFMDVYWNRFPGVYFTGDGARLDENGHFWLMGRMDDVLLVAGHNIGTMEVESALVSHPAVAEAAVIGKKHDMKGQAISAFVIIRSGYEASEKLVNELKAHVASKIGPIARPDDVIITAELPKTRSGKIMRRLLRDVAEGRALGDTTTLADPAVVQGLKDKYESAEA
ncbi:MAG: acetate--CoA ligase [Armatimonadetes bacterium]|nr:acetate--CoA ligase [Armatimonadota bacterium]